jgi:hypothetical protein
VQHTNNLVLLHLFVVLKQLLSNMGWKWFNNIRRYCKNSCLILYLLLHDCNKSTNRHWHSAWWSLWLIYLMIKPIQTRKNCFRYLKLMSHLNATICTTISYTLRVEWYYLKNNYLTLRSKVRSHEGHYGTQHTALWSCTDIPNIIDLSRKTNMLWPGQENTI